MKEETVVNNNDNNYNDNNNDNTTIDVLLDLFLKVPRDMVGFSPRITEYAKVVNVNSFLSNYSVDEKILIPMNENLIEKKDYSSIFKIEKNSYVYLYSVGLIVSKDLASQAGLNSASFEIISDSFKFKTS